MSEPIVSGIYTQRSSASSSPPEPVSNILPRTSTTNQKPRLHGPVNASSNLNSTTSNMTSTSYKTPIRLTPASSSTLSAPALAKKHVKANQNLESSSKVDKMYVKQAAPNSALVTGSDTKSQLFDGKIQDPEASQAGQSAMKASDIAVTMQPPPSGTVEMGDSTTAGREEQQNTATTSTPNPGSSNQIPTIAQRDALASRVYSVCRSAGHVNWLHLLELSPLASQHHLSGYNCMKFGIQGSPYAYFPLSLQQPWQADALIEKQRINEIEAVKWLEKKRKGKGKEQMEERGDKRGGGVLERDGSRGKGMAARDGDSGIEFITAKNEDSDMRQASPPPPPAGNPADDEIVVDGPMPNKWAVDQEYEAPLKGDRSTAEKIADAKTIEANQSQQQNSQAIKTSDSHPISISAIIPPELLIDFTHYVNKGLPEGVRCQVEKEAADDEIIAPEHCSMQIEDKRLIRCNTTRVDLCDVAHQAEREMIEAAQSKRRPRPLAFKDGNHDSYLQIICRNDEESDNDAIPVAFGGHYRGFTIGNLLLSSCPGKKVRLTGPVRGRGAICRNLGLDLKRIKQLGVGALICCLDDEELSFLGAPFSLYEKEADQLGIEVIRIPMAEGFSPTDVTLTDNLITSVVEQYTLRGVNVLVHCRGGVGRAGLIACTWMVKLGLVQPPISRQQDGNSVEAMKQQEQNNHQDMMKFCQRLIDTIRKRRSPKAIETAEQVAFLVKYITFIKSQEAQRWQQQSFQAH